MGPMVITHGEADALDAIEKEKVAALVSKGCRRSFAETPCVQLHGPFVEIVCDPDKASAHHPLGKGWNRRPG